LIVDGLSVAAGDKATIRALACEELALVPDELKALTTKKYVPGEGAAYVQAVPETLPKLVYGPPFTVDTKQL
jgi:hypothetical protein